MRLGELFRLVWLNLSQNKFKVVLTSVGIMVGSATIMLVIAIGTGGKEEVAEQFKNLNAGAIDISYEAANASSGGMGGFSMEGFFGGSTGGASGTGGGAAGMPGASGTSGGAAGMSGASGTGGGFGGGSGGFPGGFSMEGGFGDFGDFSGDDSSRINQEDITLGTDDVDDLLVFVPDVTDATISYSTSASVEGGELESAANYTIAGVEENYAGMSNLEISIGEFLSEENNENKEKVCVLGYTVARTVFGSAYDAYNEQIYIDERPYQVIGVLGEMGSMASGISPDTAVFIPYETGIKYITGTDISPTITVIAEDVNQVDTVIENIEAVLADSYPNAEFTISDAGSKMDAASASNETLSLLLISMAVIVFIVGGIGIMNVLFVSVKERTNEIGILKAIGCSRKDILLEFLFEAMCISFVGACIGVLISLAITPLVELLSVRVSLSVGGAVLSLLFGVITGSVFGFYPASKASRLVPVEALNQE